MAITNPPPLKVPQTNDPQLAAFLRQLAQFSYLLWDQVAGRGTVPVEAGGTGGNDPDSARTALGLAIGSDVQAYADGLQSISGLTTAADKMIYTTAANTYAVATLTAFARSILDDANASTARATLGLGSSNAPSFAGLTLTGPFIANSSAPANASATGAAGTVTYDSDYIYVCVATNTWKRAALSTW